VAYISDSRGAYNEPSPAFIGRDNGADRYSFSGYTPLIWNDLVKLATCSAFLSIGGCRIGGSRASGCDG